MRISVLGNSDTTGMLLLPPAKPWPSLLQERLSQSLGESVVVDNWLFAPSRTDAVGYALGLAERARPDVVAITLASFWCAFPTVHGRVQRRFGRRAARLYSRFERGFERYVERGRRPGRVTNLGRRLARRLIGTATIVSFEHFVEVYSAIIRELSQQEQLQVLVLGDHHYHAAARRAIPGLEPAIVSIQEAIQPVVAERHLHWGDLEEAITMGGRREDMIRWDGIHMTADAHQRVAAALGPMLEELGKQR